jgi:hypothetical protein
LHSPGARIGERSSAASLAELVLTHHDRRLRDPGEADWVIHAGGVAIVYAGLTGMTPAQPSSISAWRG